MLWNVSCRWNPGDPSLDGNIEYHVSRHTREILVKRPVSFKNYYLCSCVQCEEETSYRVQQLVCCFHCEGAGNKWEFVCRKRERKIARDEGYVILWKWKERIFLFFCWDFKPLRTKTKHLFWGLMTFCSLMEESKAARWRTLVLLISTYIFYPSNFSKVKITAIYLGVIHLLATQ